MLHPRPSHSRLVTVELPLQSCFSRMQLLLQTPRVFLILAMVTSPVYMWHRCICSLLISRTALQAAAHESVVPVAVACSDTSCNRHAHALPAKPPCKGAPDAACKYGRCACQAVAHQCSVKGLGPKTKHQCMPHCFLPLRPSMLPPTRTPNRMPSVQSISTKPHLAAKR